MPKIKNLHDLLIEELRDLYSAENQLLKALPKMAKAATDETLKDGFTLHLQQTRTHVERLERISTLLERPLKGKKCKAMEGLIAEGADTLSEDAPDAVKDAALICVAQKIEHYEISGYGTLRAFAELLGYTEVAKLLRETRDEEIATDEKLTVAATTINVEAEDPIEAE